MIDTCPGCDEFKPIQDDRCSLCSDTSFRGFENLNKTAYVSQAVIQAINFLDQIHDGYDASEELLSDLDKQYYEISLLDDPNTVAGIYGARRLNNALKSGETVAVKFLLSPSISDKLEYIEPFVPHVGWVPDPDDYAKQDTSDDDDDDDTVYEATLVQTPSGGFWELTFDRTPPELTNLDHAGKFKDASRMIIERTAHHGSPTGYRFVVRSPRRKGKSGGNICLGVGCHEQAISDLGFDRVVDERECSTLIDYSIE